MNKADFPPNTIIQTVSSYIGRSQEAHLPDGVMLKAKHHILDTIAAIVSGSNLKIGQVVRKYVEGQGGIREAQVIGSAVRTSAINAAFTNAVMAHADETDDSNPGAFTHPGCGIVPAALAMAEREKSDGLSFLKGVVLGYDIGCRITRALGINQRGSSHSSHSIGNNFGAAAAAAVIARLNDEQIQYVISYAAEQASGVYYVHRDQEHFEKALVFAGLPARNGVTAAVLVQSGFTGVSDPFSGPDNFFQTFAASAQPELLVAELGTRYEVMLTNIKKFSVGSPIQAPLEALLIIMRKYAIKAGDIQKIVARLPFVDIVDKVPMPDINLRYILAVTLLDGKLTFEQAHSYSRMKDPEVIKLTGKIELVPDLELLNAKIPRQGIVEVTTRDGRFFKERVISLRGTVENPMTTQEVTEKCQDLLIPVLGPERSQRLIDAILNLEKVKRCQEVKAFPHCS